MTNNPWLDQIDRSRRRERARRFRVYCWLVPLALGTALLVMLALGWQAGYISW